MPIFKYKASGRYESTALWALPTLLALGIFILSIPYTLYATARFNSHYAAGNHDYIAMLWIIFSMTLAGYLLQLFKVRNFKVALILTSIGTLLGYLLHWLMLYYFSGSELDFFGFIGERLHNGIWVHSRRRHRLFLVNNEFLLFSWVVEFLALLAAATYVASCMQVFQLFSEKYNGWYKTIALPRKVYISPRQDMDALFCEGDLAYLFTAREARKKEVSISLRLHLPPRPGQNFLSMKGGSDSPALRKYALLNHDISILRVIPISDEDAETLRGKFGKRKSFSEALFR